MPECNIGWIEYDKNGIAVESPREVNLKFADGSGESMVFIANPPLCRFEDDEINDRITHYRFILD